MPSGRRFHAVAPLVAGLTLACSMHHPPVFLHSPPPISGLKLNPQASSTDDTSHAHEQHKGVFLMDLAIFGR